jgi:hypothetical protein
VTAATNATEGKGQTWFGRFAATRTPWNPDEPQCPDMLIAGFAILGAAVFSGCALAVLHLRNNRGAPWTLAALHGLLGVAGLICLIVALGGPLRGVDQGVDSFGIIAATLIAVATLFGCGLLAMHLFKKRRFAELLIGTHATFAVGGFVFLAVYVLLG